MAEKPILFSGDMVKAVVDGKKTQTRRVIKPQPVHTVAGYEYDNQLFLSADAMQEYLFHNVYGVEGSPYGSIYSDGTGDTLWVRETWATIKSYDHLKPSAIPKIDRWPHVWYDSHKNAAVSITLNKGRNQYLGKTRPSIFMPRWASRITLKITDVRVEQVQDITVQDAFDEGIGAYMLSEKWQGVEAGYRPGLDNAVMVFSHLWDSINAKRGYGWGTNPWVWVVEFEAVQS